MVQTQNILYCHTIRYEATILTQSFIKLSAHEKMICSIRIKVDTAADTDWQFFSNNRIYMTLSAKSLYRFLYVLLI